MLEDTSFDRKRLAGIEWGLLPALGREFSEVEPTTLENAVLSSLVFFIGLLTGVFRGENEPPYEFPLSEEDQLRASTAYDLLSRLVKLPGTDDNGVVDFGYFRSWTEEVRRLAIDSARSAMCDQTLGALIARASMTPDGNCPAPEIATFMDEIGTESLFEGFEIAVLNGRDAVNRFSWGGGILERALATRYRELSELARPSSSQLAESFLRIAMHYEGYARREDEEAERRKLGR